MWRVKSLQFLALSYDHFTQFDTKTSSSSCISLLQGNKLFSKPIEITTATNTNQKWERKKDRNFVVLVFFIRKNVIIQNGRIRSRLTFSHTTYARIVIDLIQTNECFQKLFFETQGTKSTQSSALPKNNIIKEETIITNNTNTLIMASSIEHRSTEHLTNCTSLCAHIKVNQNQMNRSVCVSVEWVRLTIIDSNEPKWRKSI